MGQRIRGYNAEASAPEQAAERDAEVARLARAMQWGLVLVRT